MSQAPRSMPLVAAVLESLQSRRRTRGLLACAGSVRPRDRRAHSVDVDAWQRAIGAEHEGQNPYESGVLNWPPFWLQIIALLDAIASHVDISFWEALRIYLIMAESALVVTLYLTLVSVGARRDAVRRALLVGIALNPVAILLVCQHGNSDINVGLLVTLAVAALIAHWRSRDVVFWLCGCLLLGVGVLAKTVPLFLAPIFAPGARLAGKLGLCWGPRSSSDRRRSV